MNDALLLFLPAVVLANVPAAQAPTLEHGPIQIGTPLVLHVSKADPDARVMLLASAEPGHVDLGFGILELAPDSLVVAAEGTAGPDGAVSFSFPTPLELGAVEAPLHVQAGVLAPDGAPTLTPALHLRLLASRVYVGSRDMGGAPGRLQAYSAVTGELLFEREDLISLSVESGAGEDELPLVVLNHDHGRAAYVPSPDRLVIFDNFSGAELAVLPGAGLSRRLHVDSTGRHLYALQSEPARLWRIDFDSGGVLATLDLSRPVDGSWTAADAPALAFVPTAGGARGASVGIVRVDLDAMVELDQAELVAAGALTTSWIGDLGWSGSELIVTGVSHYGPYGGIPKVTGFLSRVSWEGTSPLVETSLLEGFTVGALLVAPALDWGLILQHLAFEPWWSFLAFPTQDVGAAAPFPKYPVTNDVVFLTWSFDGRRVWMIGDDVDGDPFYTLWAFDLATFAWYELPPPGWVDGYCWWEPVDLARVKDAFVDRVFTTGWNDSPGVECWTLPDRLFVSEIESGFASWHVELPGRPVLLEAVVLP